MASHGDSYTSFSRVSSSPHDIQQDVIDDFLKMEDHGEVSLDGDSVYGLAFAMPQIARSLPNRLFIALAARSYFLLILNCILQAALLCFIGQAVQVMDLLNGRMHLCDFGANLAECPGGKGCMGPGGTNFTKHRLYDYTQWAIQKFVKQALLDIVPEKSQLIEDHVDPGEFGMENYWCRFVSCFLLAVSMLGELYSIFDMITLLWYVPNEAESWIEFKDRECEDEPVDEGAYGPEANGSSQPAERKTFPSLEYVSFKVKGMPRYWKAINVCVVLFPKIFLWWFVVWQGFILLMETASNVDLVLGSLAVSFITSVDEILLDSLSSKSARYIMNAMEEFTLKVDHSHVTLRKFLVIVLPRRFFLALLITCAFIGKYYYRKCRWDGDYEMYVSQDVKYPSSVVYEPWDLLGRRFIRQEHDPFWTMPTPADGD